MKTKIEHQYIKERGKGNEKDVFWYVFGLSSIFICLLVTFGVIFGVICDLKLVKEKIELCKSNGYDGVRFVSRYSNEVECSDFPEEKERK